MDPKKALIAIGELKTKVPTWPYTPWGTWAMARQGRMPTIRIGRRYFVTLELLEQFYAQSTSKKPKAKRARKTKAVETPAAKGGAA